MNWVPKPYKPNAFEIAVAAGMKARDPSASASVASLVVVCISAIAADIAFHDGVGGVGVLVFTVLISAGLIAAA